MDVKTVMTCIWYNVSSAWSWRREDFNRCDERRIRGEFLKQRIIVTLAVALHLTQVDKTQQIGQKEKTGLSDNIWTKKWKVYSVLRTNGSTLHVHLLSRFKDCLIPQGSCPLGLIATQVGSGPCSNVAVLYVDAYIAELQGRPLY